MPDLALAALFAVFIWWFSTGLILLLDNLPRGTFRWSLVISSAVALAALAGLLHTAGQTTVAGTYCAFTCALLVWGWHELSFLTGWITGPRTQPLPQGLAPVPRFWSAVQTILWHELGILAMAGLIIAITWGQPNQTGTWTFLVLWAMRTSAKLNLYYGVRNLSEEFLPPHLIYLQSYFRRRAMNWFFPWSVTAACAVLAWLVALAVALQTPPIQALGLTLVGTMLALAILEHAFLVLPINATAMWRWAMRHRPGNDRNLPDAPIRPNTKEEAAHVAIVR